MRSQPAYTKIFANGYPFDPRKVSLSAFRLFASRAHPVIADAHAPLFSDHRLNWGEGGTHLFALLSCVAALLAIALIRLANMSNMTYNKNYEQTA